jgi:hypothetical protein
MEVTKHDAAQWPSDETDTESRKRQERAGRRIVRGKKQLPEGQRRNQAVNEEIVPIHHRAGEAGSCCPESRGFRGGTQRTVADLHEELRTESGHSKRRLSRRESSKNFTYLGAIQSPNSSSLMVNSDNRAEVPVERKKPSRLSRKPRLAEPPPKPKKLSHREQRWDYRHSKKIRPCVQKTEHLSPIFGSAATGHPNRSQSLA